MVEIDPKIDQMDKDILPFEMGYLPEFFQRKAEIELGDSPENRQKGLKILRGMIESDKHLKGLTFDDDFLLQYLRCRKFNANMALSQIKALVNLRKNYNSAFRDFNFKNIVKTIDNRVVTFLPYRCPDGCAILFVQTDNWNPEEFPVEDLKRMVVIFVLQSLRDPMTQVNGIKFIFDFKSNPIRHIRYATPSNLYLMYHGPVECAPTRIKGIHIVNLSFTGKVCWTLVRPFLSSKMKKRVHFHDTPESLLNFFPAAILPVEYGGELKDYDMTDWLRDVMSPEKLATLGGGEYPVK